ncbi:MAG: hypothetical protein LC650_04670 [Actinobacteria bacterium]|nr:hypothetical protein [Actinomycetota bacterium]
MRRNDIEEIVVDGPENIRVVKDTDDFGGPNMWNLEIKRPDGFWESIQWMNVYRAEELLGVELPHYDVVQREYERAH